MKKNNNPSTGSRGKRGSPKAAGLRKYAGGWLPDIPDGRDFLYQGIKPKRLRLPAKVDLRGYCSAVENQGRLGSCTANALAGNIEFLDNKTDLAYTNVSRLFIYYNERVLEKTVAADSGAMLRDGIKTLHKQGVCSESAWPYQIKNFAKKPSFNLYEEAQGHCIESYHRLTTHSDRLTCLGEGFPFVFGFAVYESFESAETARTGMASMPKKSERMLGGHAVLAVGFDQQDKRFIVRNSWGTSWGMNGYFTMPFEYLDQLADDFWTIRK